jgi:hypothetical protein
MAWHGAGASGDVSAAVRKRRCGMRQERARHYTANTAGMKSSASIMSELTNAYTSCRASNCACARRRTVRAFVSARVRV